MTPRLLALPLAALALVPAAGCMQKTVKATERRVLTAEEAAEAEQRRKEEQKDAKPAPPPPPPPSTPEQEIDRFRAETEKEPQNPKWHFLLGMAYEKQRKYALAELRYRRGAEAMRDKLGSYTGPHFYLGRVLAKEEKWTEALEELERAVAVKPADMEGYYLNPDYREGHFLIGFVQHRLKNLGESEKAFKQFLKYGGERDRVIDFFPHLIAE